MPMYKSLSEALKNSGTCTMLKISIKDARFPLELLTLTQLEELYIDAPLLEELPSFAALTKLRILSLKASVFKASIEELFLLPSLANLKLLETPLEPLRIKLASRMAPLTSLTLKQAGLKQLPLEIGELGKLEELILPNNHLSELPFTFAGMRELKRLNLDSNAFAKFPDSLKGLPKLHHVSIDANPFAPLEKARIQRHFGITPS